MKYPETWPGTNVIKSAHTPFNWRVQPSELPREGQQYINHEPMRDNTGAAFMPAILSQADRDAAFKIRAAQ